mmetsp:Transcript_18797/g.41129  ORF Transcript_18797/g.41129 Transcript_18797/m.41129 type:complete len:312 (+) Transcript_18797:241-1176(+)
MTCTRCLTTRYGMLQIDLHSEHSLMLPLGSNVLLHPLRMFMPARITSSTNRSCEAITGAECRIWRLTQKLSYTPSIDGLMGSPVTTSNPTTLPFTYSSVSSMFFSCASKPEFSASVLGMTSSASANASTPSLARPCTVAITLVRRLYVAATSNAPAPCTTALSLRTLFTARRPSRTASLICAMLWSFCPLISTVHAPGFFGSSTKVYTSSPRTCSYTLPAKPHASGSSSSSEFTAYPPQHSTRRSMLRFLARRSATMPARANISREMGSMPFWLITTKFLSVPSHIFFLRAMTASTRMSVNLRSALTNLSR